jgi:hypothetical protein
MFEKKLDTNKPPAVEKHEAVESILDFIVEKYEVVDNAAEADLSINITEMYRKLKEFFPSHNFSMDDLMIGLISRGFVFDTFGDLNFFWLMREKK